MIISQFLILLATIITGFGVLYWLLSRRSASTGDAHQLEAMVNQAFGLITQKVAEQSKQILAGEKESIHLDLENKQQVIEKLVNTLQTEMRERQVEIRQLEQDRIKKFSEITTTLNDHRRLAEELRVTTQQLASILSHNQTRGEWGERIIEDLLQSNGLVEGVHYARQLPLPHTDQNLRPDITLLLPNQRLVAVDVKFPYAEIQKMADADSKAIREQHLKQFAQDLKIKIHKVAEYIQPAAKTLDYAILFVPNEMIFSFINQKFPELVDDAMAQRVMIVSPFTFLIVARTVMESYRNFMMEDKLRDIVQYVSDFVGEWGKFKDEFQKFGRSIETLKTGYDMLSTTRTNQMERKIKKIESYRQGGILEKTSSKKLERVAE